MPYFVYYITQHADSNRKSLEHIETLANFKAARNLAREKRAQLREAGDNRED